MANNVEWARLANPYNLEIEVAFGEPGEIRDPFGNQNDLPALFFGDGICIEDTKENWITFATKLLAAAQELPDEEEE